MPGPVTLGGTPVMLHLLSRTSRAPGHGAIQPPTVADEHRPAVLPVHEKSNDDCGLAFGLMPRCTHINVQPRTHVMLVGPAGASTTSSKSGTRD
jgi:hypothetical protein